MDNAPKHYADACHAMQTGVAMELQLDPSGGTPKHLRVGVNVALRDHASLVLLLVQKGIITQEEYIQAITEGMNAEVREYEAKLSERLGGVVKLD